MKRTKRLKTAPHDWAPYRADERALRPLVPHGRFRLALAYANVYAVGMSSLGFQRAYELVYERPDWVAERFFLDGDGMPLSVERDASLDSFSCVAFSVSFEEDYTNLLAMLDRARIPLRREQRGPWHPLVVMGGSCAAINPLPMADFVDAFVLGAAENTLGGLLEALEEHGGDREAVLERLAATPGYFVPAHHHPERDEALPKLHKLELTAEQLLLPGHLPSSCIVTPRTEFSEKVLIEMSRGCPEKCKYCWATFGMGKFRAHPTRYILEALDRAAGVTDQVGFLATAVGDHPEIARILTAANEKGFRSSVSSIRIPAVQEETLAPLFASGARSITLAPETGSDRLRFLMNKPITNETLLEKVRLIFASGFTQLKLYFIIGLPGETDDDVHAILSLGARCASLMREVASKTGKIGNVHLGTNILIPKPYTPWQREAMDDERSLKAKISMLKRGVAKLPNVTLTTMSPRQAVWQTYISRAGRDASGAIQAVARGAHLSTVLRDHAAQIHPEVFQEFPRELRWHFMRMG